MISKRMNINHYVEKLLSFRPRSQFEIEQKLRFKKYPPQEIKNTIKKLKDDRLIDDKTFAMLWVSNRENLSPRGKRLLELELRQKGIAQEIIEEVLASYSTEYQIDLVLKLLEDKLQDKKVLQDFQKKQKILAHLARRGFDYNVSKRALEIYLENDKI